MSGLVALQTTRKNSEDQTLRTTGLYGFVLTNKAVLNDRTWFLGASKIILCSRTSPKCLFPIQFSGWEGRGRNAVVEVTYSNVQHTVDILSHSLKV